MTSASLSGAHLPIFRKLQVLDAFAEPVGFAVVAGGVMPEEDEETLKKMGVAAVLGQDTTPDTIVGAVRTAAADRTVGV